MTGYARQEDGPWLEEASGWIARLQRDDLTEADGMAFDAWLEASPRNRAAYAQALAVWTAYDTSADEVLDALANARPQRRAYSRRWAIGAGGLAAAAALAVAVLPSMQQESTFQSHVTGNGERRDVKLDDGSVIHLNAATQLSVRMGRDDRRVLLGDGEAIFDVASDASRPFTVETPTQVVRVVGTQFDVRNRSGDLTVTVARGAVEVRPAGDSAGRAYRLSPGQRLRIARSGETEFKAVDPAEVFSWRAGRLVYREEPLANVVADLNREFATPIRLEDSELGLTPISGVIVLDSQSAVLQRLTLMLPIRSVPSDQGLLLLRK